MELKDAINSLNSQLGEERLKYDSKIPEIEMEDLFLNAIEDLDKEDEDKLSDDIFVFYESVSEKHDNSLNQKIKMENQTMSEEKGFKDYTEQEKIKFLLGIFKYWAEKGHLTVEIPEEITLKLLEKIFLQSLEQMPWDTKMAGGYTKEIDQYFMFLKIKPKKQKKPSNKAQLEEEIALRKANLSLCLTIVSSVTDQVVAEGEDNAASGTALLKAVLESTPEQFNEMLQNEDFRTIFRQLLIERKIDQIKVRKVRGVRKVKKWDGEGEPFSATTPQGEPSMTYEIWKRVLKGKSSINSLNKYSNEKFPKANGKERDVTNVVRKIAGKVVDFYTITIPQDPDGKIQCEKVG